LLRELGLDPVLTSAATRFFERSTQLALAGSFEKTPQEPDEVVAALEALLRNV
jgi:hypothetical protein